jgi:hypothetical protein|tara:strand:- start:423 stop:593 length:171 start_codon:yes stop_codon:yes gene_type:complete
MYACKRVAKELGIMDIIKKDLMNFAKRGQLNWYNIYLAGAGVIIGMRKPGLKKKAV